MLTSKGKVSKRIALVIYHSKRHTLCIIERSAYATVTSARATCAQKWKSNNVMDMVKLKPSNYTRINS